MRGWIFGLDERCCDGERGTEISSLAGLGFVCSGASEAALVSCFPGVAPVVSDVAASRWRSSGSGFEPIWPLNFRLGSAGRAFADGQECCVFDRLGGVA